MLRLPRNVVAGVAFLAAVSLVWMVGALVTVHAQTQPQMIVGFPDPCSQGAKTFVLINTTAGATLITGTAGKNVYLCHVQLVTAGALNIAVVEGTGTVCATGIAGLMGGSTAATGWNFAANGGLVAGTANASIAKTATAADNVCVLTSGATQISGNLSYVSGP